MYMPIVKIYVATVKILFYFFIKMLCIAFQVVGYIS